MGEAGSLPPKTRFCSARPFGDKAAQNMREWGGTRERAKIECYATCNQGGKISRLCKAILSVQMEIK